MLNLYRLERQTVAYVNGDVAARRERLTRAVRAARTADVRHRLGWDRLSLSRLGLLPRLAATWTRTSRLRPFLP